MKKSQYKFCVMFSKRPDDPWRFIPDDTWWKTRDDANKERFKRQIELTDKELDMGCSYTVKEVKRESSKSLARSSSAGPGLRGKKNQGILDKSKLANLPKGRKPKLSGASRSLSRRRPGLHK